MVRKGMKTILLIAALLMIPTSGIVYAEEGTEPPSTETPSAAQDYPQEETKEPAIHTERNTSSGFDDELPDVDAPKSSQEPAKMESSGSSFLQDFNSDVTPVLNGYPVRWGTFDHGSINLRDTSGSDLYNETKCESGAIYSVTMYPDPGYRYKAGSLENKTTPAIKFTEDQVNKYVFTMPEEEVLLDLEFELIPNYDQTDVTLINEVIQAHPEAFNQDLIDQPEQWDFVTWDTIGNNMLGIIALDLSGRGLQGSLDVRYLSYLKTLSCANNSLTELFINEERINTLDCRQNQLQTLRISWFTVLNCEGNPMDSLEIVNAGIQYRSLSVNISDEDKQAGNAAYIQSFNGSVTSTPTYTLKAFPAADYQFAGWKIGNSIYVKSTTVLEWVNSNTTVQANFKIPLQILLPPNKIVVAVGQELHIIPTVLPENAPNKEVTFVVIDLGKFDLRKDPDNPNAFFLKGKETGSEQFDLYVERFSKNLSVQVIDRAFIQPAFTENTISGVKGSYELDSSLSFTAKGSGLDNQEPLWEDWRWVPVRWAIDKQNADSIQGTVSSGEDQQASLSGLSAGNHELIVEFQKEIYNNWSWEPAETESLSAVFSITEPKPTPAPTPTPTATPKPSESENPTQNVNVPSSQAPRIIKKPKPEVKATATPEPTSTPAVTPKPAEKPGTPPPSATPAQNEIKKGGWPWWTPAAAIPVVAVIGAVLFLKRRSK